MEGKKKKRASIKWGENKDSCLFCDTALSVANGGKVYRIPCYALLSNWLAIAEKELLCCEFSEFFPSFPSFFVVALKRSEKLCRTVDDVMI